VLEIPVGIHHHPGLGYQLIPDAGPQTDRQMSNADKSRDRSEEDSAVNSKLLLFRKKGDECRWRRGH
jgi:hypothetical protein